MQPLYIILGVIVIFLVLLHLTRQNDEIIENLAVACIGETCVDENQIKNLLNSNSNNDYAYGVNSAGHIYERKADGSGNWRRIPGNKKNISVGKNHIWGVNRQNHIYRCDKPCNGKWTRVPGRLTQIDTN